MTFRKQLGFYLTRKFGSTDDKKSWADACGLEYNYFVVIMSGAKKPPSEDKIIEIAKSLDLSDAETETLLALSLKEKAKSPETKGLLSRLLKETSEAMDDFSRNTTLKQIIAMRNGPDNVVALKAETHTIPIYTTIKAGNGEMGITDGESDGEISITEEYYKQKVFALRVSGDSMAPELYDGEIALFKPINGDRRLKVSVSFLARNIQFAQSKRIYHNHHSDHKAI